MPSTSGAVRPGGPRGRGSREAGDRVRHTRTVEEEPRLHDPVRMDQISAVAEKRLLQNVVAGRGKALLR